jgi:uncharacterized membrane protein YiaA
MLFDTKTFEMWGLMFLAIGFFIWKSSGLKLAMKLFKNRAWVINFVIMLAFSAYLILDKPKDSLSNQEYDLRIEALKKAIFGFIIALMVHFRMVIAPFWIIFFIGYYLNGWV